MNQTYPKMKKLKWLKQLKSNIFSICLKTKPSYSEQCIFLNMWWWFQASWSANQASSSKKLINIFVVRIPHNSKVNRIELQMAHWKVTQRISLISNTQGHCPILPCLTSSQKNLVQFSDQHMVIIFLGSWNLTGSGSISRRKILFVFHQTFQLASHLVRRFRQQYG